MILDLLRVLKDPENYEKFSGFIPQGYLPPEAQSVIAAIKHLHETNDPISSYDDVLMQHMISHPSDKNFFLVKKLCESLKEAEKIAPPNQHVVESLLNRYFAERIVQEAELVAGGSSSSLAKVRDLIQEANEKIELSLDSEEDSLHEDMYKTLLERPAHLGYEFRMKCLNILIGNLSNQLVIVGSRPDGGKTSLFAQESWYIARQLPDARPVLWFNNEESIKEVKKRVISSCLGICRNDIESDPLYSIRKFHRKIGGEEKIIFVDDSHDMKIIDRYVNKFNPGLIIIDQLYKVGGDFANSEIDAEKFRQKCAYAREIAKHVCPVLVSNQLDGSASGVKFPGMETLYGSKTGAQGEADIIVLLGRTDADPDIRYVYTPKNKRTGSLEKHEVRLIKEVARYEAV